MIYHICPPDHKFLHSLVYRFEQVKPGFNRCVVIVSRDQKNTNLNLDKNLIEYFGPFNDEVRKRFLNSTCHGIVVHTLNDDILELALNFLGYFPVIWRSWGTDLHDVLYPDLNLLLPYTQELVYGGNRLYQSSIKCLRHLYHHISGKDKERNVRVSKKIEFLKSINFIATTTQTEFELLQKKIPGIRAKYLPLNYRSLDIDKLPELNSAINKNMNMAGHSSYSYHNHADIFYQLKNDSYGGSISAPLNYGDVGYRDKVIKLGEKLFNGQIEFLTDFLKFDDYLKFINKYSAFILNSKVQSGGGNIMYFLYQGSKVYLREENPIYKDYKKNGIKLFSIQLELSSKHLLQYDISTGDKLNNRKIIESMFSSQREKENVINAYKALSVTI